MAAPARDDHCWHMDRGTATREKSSIYALRCCQCGHNATTVVKPAPLPGHGPFFVMEQLTYPKRELCYPKF